MRNLHIINHYLVTLFFLSWPALPLWVLLVIAFACNVFVAFLAWLSVFLSCDCSNRCLQSSDVGLNRAGPSGTAHPTLFLPLLIFLECVSPEQHPWPAPGLSPSASIPASLVLFSPSPCSWNQMPSWEQAMPRICHWFHGTGNSCRAPHI